MCIKSKTLWTIDGIKTLKLDQDRRKGTEKVVRTNLMRQGTEVCEQDELGESPNYVRSKGLSRDHSGLYGLRSTIRNCLTKVFKRKGDGKKKKRKEQERRYRRRLLISVLF